MKFIKHMVNTSLILTKLNKDMNNICIGIPNIPDESHTVYIICEDL